MKKSKIITIVLASVAGLLLVGGLLWFFLSGSGDGNNGFAPIVTNLNTTVINNVTVVNDNKVVYDNGDGLKLSVEPATDADKKAVEDAEVGDAKGESVKNGTTKEGKEWKSDGNIIVVDDKKVTVEKNDKKKDNGKVAAVATALDAKKGYTKGVVDYNQNYAVYYIEEAECLFYYPKQLTLVKEGEDQSLLFRDTRSKAELKVKLTENEFECMDDVESLIADSEYSQILATGTDWFSAESYGKGTTTFSLTGLGNKYAVEASFTYEKQYEFVFLELRKLIKCKFINGGIWVSNAKRDTAGKKVKAVEKQPSVYDPALDRTSYYSQDLKCVVAYPDIFSKIYDNGITVSLTDPATGACIRLTREFSEEPVSYYMEEYGGNSAELVSDHSMRAGLDDSLVFITMKDGYVWTATMTFESEYRGIYAYASDMFAVYIEGDDINNTEMQEIYYPDYDCCVRIPIQYYEYAVNGDEVRYRDEFTGMEARLSFAEVTSPDEYNNLFNKFEVIAKDDAIDLGEDIVKWHNKYGVFVGAVGRKNAAMLEITATNAYDVYKNCWKEFDISFSKGAEYISDAEEIREEAKAVVVLNSAREEKVKPDADPGTYYKKATDNSSVKTGNTAEKLEEKDKKPAKKVEKSKGNEPNRVLYYKTETDYLDVITSADEWVYAYKEMFPEPRDTRLARFYTVLFSMNVLEYNGYTLPDDADDVFLIADDVDTLVRFLMDSGERIDSQLGEGVISVFEVLCFYLGIDEVPIYVMDDYEPATSFDKIAEAAQGKEPVPDNENNISGPDEPQPSILDGYTLLDNGRYLGEDGNEYIIEEDEDMIYITQYIEPDDDPYEVIDDNPDEVPDEVPDEEPDEVPDDGWDDIDPNEAKGAREAFSALPFDDVPDFREDDSVFGCFSFLVFDRTDRSLPAIYDAMDIIIDHGFELVEEDLEYEEMYIFEGAIPGSYGCCSMYILVEIRDYEIRVIYYTTSQVGGEEFPGDYSLINAGFDYSTLYEIRHIFSWFKEDVEKAEGAKGKNGCYYLSYEDYNLSDMGYEEYLQGIFDDGEVTRNLLTMEVVYYDDKIYDDDGNYTQTYISHTYIYLPVEGETIFLWEHYGQIG